MLRNAPLTSRDVMMRLIVSMSTTASCIKIASSGKRSAIAPHIVGGMAQYTTGAMRFRMSIQMSFVSVVADTIGLQLTGFAQLPFLYSACTRVAQSGGMSVLAGALLQRRAVRRLFRLSGTVQ